MNLGQQLMSSATVIDPHNVPDELASHVGRDAGRDRRWTTRRR